MASSRDISISGFTRVGGVPSSQDICFFFELGSAERSSLSLSLSLSADCPSGQDPPEADEKDASGGPCRGGRRARSARLSLPLSADCPSGQDPPEAKKSPNLACFFYAEKEESERGEFALFLES